MRRTVRLTESELVNLIKRVLSEGSVGDLAKNFRKVITRTEDDLITYFRISEEAKAAKNFLKSKILTGKLNELDALQAQIIHFYNPSGDIKNLEEAKKNMVKYLNAYAKSEGKNSWGQIRGELGDPKYSKYGKGSPKGQPNEPRPKNDDTQPMYSKVNKFSKNRISNRSFGGSESYIDVNDINWDYITNNGRSYGARTPEQMMDYYNKVIAKSIETGDFSMISARGFEKHGIDNFREFLKNNILRVYDLDPKIGRWSVQFK